MDNKLFILIFFTSVILCAGHAAFAGRAPGKTFTVVIDPGHGGQDPGAVYKAIREKDIVLRLALKLGSYIGENMPDTKVIYTRDRDIFIPLHQRAAIANNNKADLFISLHANFCSTPSISGTETFVLGLHRSEENLDVAKKENSVILMEEDYTARYEGFDPNSSESYIMFEMVQDEYLDQSITIGALVQEQFRNRAIRSDRGVKQAGFLVLRKIGMPGVLIESGFLSNPTEAQYLNSEKGVTNLALSIYQAFKLYKSSVETKSDFRLVTRENVQKQIDSVLSESKKEIMVQPEEMPGQIAQEEQIISAETRNKKINHDEIWFSVQVAAATSKIETTPSNFKGLQMIYMIEHNGKFKYMYAKEESYRSILKRRTEVLKYFPDAFIVAFKNGQPVPVKSVMNNQKP
ncbi:MAG: N-acetylmuramoyl-L-alanine amidase [Prolixibacteraceae bacterium]